MANLVEPRGTGLGAAAPDVPGGPSGHEGELTALVRRWVQAIRANFTGPLYWCLELGKHGRVHPHVLTAGDAGLLLHRLRRGGTGGEASCAG